MKLMNSDFIYFIFISFISFLFHFISFIPFLGILKNEILLIAHLVAPDVSFWNLRNCLECGGGGCGFEPRRWHFITNVRMCKCITRNALTHSPSQNPSLSGARTWADRSTSRTINQEVKQSVSTYIDPRPLKFWGNRGQSLIV